MQTLEEQVLIMVLTNEDDTKEVKKFLESEFSIGELKRLGEGLDRLLCSVDEELEERAFKMNKVETMIADHVADAMAIENIAWMFYCQNAEKLGRAPLDWKDVPVKVKESHLRMAQSSVLNWLNAEYKTDYKLED